jgi:hypothetical protein
VSKRLQVTVDGVPPLTMRGTEDSGDRSPGAALLNELRASQSREDIARYLAEFGAVAGSDSSSRKLAEATGGHVDLAIPAHRAAAITWLRAWGCRHLRRADTIRTSEALRTWWTDWGARLPGEHATLTGLGEVELAVAGHAYDALRTTPAAGRTVRGRELDVAFGDTAAGKLMFALRPQAFPPWDEAIRLAFGRPSGGAAYVRMLRLSAAALNGLARRLSVPVGGLPEALGRPGSSPPKLIDEYLLIRVTKGR